MTTRRSVPKGSQQKARWERVLKICKVDRQRVRLLAKKLGVVLPSGRRAGSRHPIGNVCHALGVALSKLFRGEASYGYPVRVVGSGIAGLVFIMDDGTIIKAVELKPSKGGGGFRGERGLAPGGDSVSLGEFVHEIAMFRAARKAFGRHFQVPKVMRSVVLRGRKGARVAVFQMTRAPGTTMADFTKPSAHVSQALRELATRMHGRALARLHDRGWCHGDMHTGNVMVEVRNGAPRLSVIDWGRANTRRGIASKLASSPDALWAKILRYEIAHVYNDIMRNFPQREKGRHMADLFLDEYIRSRKSGNHVPGREEVRRDYDGMARNNLGAVFRALELVSKDI